MKDNYIVICTLVQKVQVISEFRKNDYFNQPWAATVSNRAKTKQPKYRLYKLTPIHTLSS